VTAPGGNHNSDRILPSVTAEGVVGAAFGVIFNPTTLDPHHHITMRKAHQ
jgi:hypothetical protein